MNTAGIAAKKNNIRKILREIIETPDISRSELARRFSLSPATVTIAVNELLEKGLVLEGSVQQSPMGRKAKLLHLNEQLYTVLAADITATATLDLRLCDLRGSNLAARTFAFPAGPFAAPDAVCGFVCQCARDFLGSVPKTLSKKLLGAAVIVPGLIRHDGTVDAPLYGWERIPLSSALGSALGVSVFCDTLLRILGQYEIQFLREATHVVYLSLDAGVGLACFEDGQLLTGRNLLYGEVGHISLNEQGPTCYCGNRGCFEYYCGTSGILARLEILAKQGICPILTAAYRAAGNQMTLELAMRAYHEGSSAVRGQLDEVSAYLGRALVSICNLLDPDQVVLAGRLGRENYILQNALALVRSRMLARTFNPPVFSLAYLSADTYEMGVCHYVLGRMLEVLLA